MLKRRKKGFTLAELLIVVAIIAVLVAIAVPLFVGSLNKAKESRNNANIRAVRGAAVVYLLENTDDGDLWKTPTNGWNVTAEISSSGSIISLEVKNEAVGDTKDECKDSTTAGQFTVTLHVDNTDITSLVEKE